MEEAYCYKYYCDFLMKTENIIAKWSVYKSAFNMQHGIDSFSYLNNIYINYST